MPIVHVEAAPENGSAVLVDELLGDHAAHVGFMHDDANGVILLAADGHDIAPNNVHQLLFAFAGGKHIAFAGDESLWDKVDLVAAIVLAKTPVDEEFLAVQEGVHVLDAAALVGFGEDAAMGVRQLRHKGTLDILIAIAGLVEFHGIVGADLNFHTLDAMHLGAAHNGQMILLRADAFREVIHGPGKLFAQLGHDEPAHQLLPSAGKSREGRGRNGVIRQRFRHNGGHRLFSFRSGWKGGPEVLAGVVEAALDGSQRNAEMKGDVLLGQLLPVAQAEDLLILRAEGFQGVEHQAVPDTGKAGRQNGDAFSVRQRNLLAAVFATQIIRAFVSGDTQQPGFEADFFPQRSIAVYCSGENLLQHVLRIGRMIDAEAHVSLDGEAALCILAFKIFHGPPPFCEKH